MVAGLILAAGPGRRFGGRKQLAPLNGRPLLQAVIERAEASRRLDRVFVVIGSDACEIERRVSFGRCEPVRCVRWSEGMSASLRCGLRTAAEADIAVIALGDQPGLEPSMISKLLDSLAPEELAVRASFGGRPGHPVVVRSALFEPLGALAGDQGGREVLAEAGVRSIQCDAFGDGHDVDTPADLALVRASDRHPARVSSAERDEVKVDPATRRRRRSSRI